MKMKSVRAGEYTAPPAHGPMMAEICGMTPDARVLRRKMSAYPPSETTPSWMRAPPESFKPMTGAPFFSAMSMTLTDLLGMHFPERAAKDGEILGKNIDQASVDRAPAGHDRVAHELLFVQPEIVGAVLDEGIHFAEGAFIEQQVDALAGGEAAFFVLGSFRCARFARM
jgi:hypothetical protein